MLGVLFLQPVFCTGTAYCIYEDDATVGNACGDKVKTLFSKIADLTVAKDDTFFFAQSGKLTQPMLEKIGYIVSTAFAVPSTATLANDVVITLDFTGVATLKSFTLITEGYITAALASGSLPVTGAFDARLDLVKATAFDLSGTVALTLPGKATNPITGLEKWTSTSAIKVEVPTATSFVLDQSMLHFTVGEVQVLYAAAQKFSFSITQTGPISLTLAGDFSLASQFILDFGANLPTFNQVLGAPTMTNPIIITSSNVGSLTLMVENSITAAESLIFTKGGTMAVSVAKYDKKTICLYSSATTQCKKQYFYVKSSDSSLKDLVSAATKVQVAEEVSIDVEIFKSPITLPGTSWELDSADLKITTAKAVTAPIVMDISDEKVKLLFTQKVSFTSFKAPKNSISECTASTISVASPVIILLSTDSGALAFTPFDTSILAGIELQASVDTLKLELTASAPNINFQGNTFEYPKKPLIFSSSAKSVASLTLKSTATISTVSLEAKVTSKTLLVIDDGYTTEANEFLKISCSEKATFSVIQKDAKNKPFVAKDGSVTITYSVSIRYCFAAKIIDCTGAFPDANIIASELLTSASADKFQEATKFYIAGTGLTANLEDFVDKGATIVNFQQEKIAVSDTLSLTLSAKSPSTVADYEVTLIKGISLSDNELTIKSLTMLPTSLAGAAATQKVTVTNAIVLVDGETAVASVSINRLSSTNPIELKLAQGKTESALELNDHNLIYTGLTWPTAWADDAPKSNKFKFTSVDKVTTFSLKYSSGTSIPALFFINLDTATIITIEAGTTVNIPSPFLTIEGVGAISFEVASAVELTSFPFVLNTGGPTFTYNLPSTYCFVENDGAKAQCGNVLSANQIVIAKLDKEYEKAKKIIICGNCETKMNPFIDTANSNTFDMSDTLKEFIFKESSKLVFTSLTPAVTTPKPTVVLKGNAELKGTFPLHSLTVPPSGISTASDPKSISSEEGVKIVISEVRQEADFKSLQGIFALNTAITYVIVGDKMDFTLKKAKEISILNNLFAYDAPAPTLDFENANLKSSSVHVTLGYDPQAVTDPLCNLMIFSTTSISLGTGFSDKTSAGIIGVDLHKWVSGASFTVQIPSSSTVNKPFTASNQAHAIDFNYNSKTELCITSDESSKKCESFSAKADILNSAKEMEKIISTIKNPSYLKIYIVEDVTISSRAFTTSSAFSLLKDRIIISEGVKLAVKVEAEPVTSKLLATSPVALVSATIDTPSVLMTVDSAAVDLSIGSVNCYGSNFVGAKSAVTASLIIQVDVNDASTHECIGANSITLADKALLSYVSSSDKVSVSLDPSKQLIQIGECKVSWPTSEQSPIAHITNAAAGSESTIADLKVNFVASKEQTQLTKKIQFDIQASTTVELLDGFSQQTDKTILVNAHDAVKNTQLNIKVPEGVKDVFVNAGEGQIVPVPVPKPAPAPTSEPGLAGWAIAVIVIVVVIVVAVVVVLVLNFTGVIHLCGNKDDAPSV